MVVLSAAVNRDDQDFLRHELRLLFPPANLFGYLLRGRSILPDGEDVDPKTEIASEPFVQDQDRSVVLLLQGRFHIVEKLRTFHFHTVSQETGTKDQKCIDKPKKRKTEKNE